MNEENNAPVAPSWFIDEGVAGTGDRPQWLPEKFKSAADMAKSYHELERKFSTPPEEYDLSSSKFLDTDYEPIQDFLKFAKERRVPKDVMDKMSESLDKYMDEFSTDYEEEARKLGDNAKERLTTLDNWAMANMSEDSYRALTANLKSADAIKALEELRGKMMSNATMVPSGNDAVGANVATLDDIRAELSQNYNQYKTDEKYRKDISARMAQAAKNTPGFVDKVGA